jgi:hypothetical protein
MKSSVQPRVAGPVNLGDEGWMLACLRLANWKHTDPVAEANTAYGEVISGTKGGGVLFRALGRPQPKGGYPRVIRLGGSRPDQIPSAVPELIERLRRALDEFLGKRRIARRDLVARANSAIRAINGDGIRTGVRTTLRVAGDGALEHLHGYFPGGGEGAEGLLLAFLLSPRHTYGTDLRVCALDGCREYFLAKKNSRGGPRRVFCSIACQLKADAAQAVERARKKRKRDAAKRDQEGEAP